MIIDTSLFHWFFLRTFARCFAFYNCQKELLKPKSKFPFAMVFMILLKIATSLTTWGIERTEANIMLSVFGYYGLMSLTVFLFYEGKVLKKIFVYVVTLCLELLNSAIGGAILTAIYTNIYGQTMEKQADFSTISQDYLVTFLFELLITIVLSYAFVFILRAYKLIFKKSDKANAKYLFFLITPMTHIVFGFTSATENALTNIQCILLGVCVIFDIAFIFIIDHFQNVEENNRLYQQKLLQNELDYALIQTTKEERAKLRKTKHDYINLLSTVKGFLEIEQTEKATTVINETIDDLSSVSKLPFSNNDTINTILNLKNKKATDSGIEIKATVNETFVIKTSDYDLSRILFNLLDNSIEALENSDKEKICNIEIFADTDKVEITVSNICNTKDTKSNIDRGNGTGIIKEIAKKYNGKYTFIKEPLHNDKKHSKATATVTMENI